MVLGRERENITLFRETVKIKIISTSVTTIYHLVCQFLARSAGKFLDNFARKSIPVCDHDLCRFEIQFLRSILSSGPTVDLSGGGGHFDPVLTGTRPRTIGTEMSRITPGKCFSGRVR